MVFCFNTIFLITSQKKTNAFHSCIKILIAKLFVCLQILNDLFAYIDWIVLFMVGKNLVFSLSVLISQRKSLIQIVCVIPMVKAICKENCSLQQCVWTQNTHVTIYFSQLIDICGGTLPQANSKPNTKKYSSNDLIGTYDLMLYRLMILPCIFKENR